MTAAQKQRRSRRGKGVSIREAGRQMRVTAKTVMAAAARGEVVLKTEPTATGGKQMYITHRSLQAYLRRNGIGQNGQQDE